MNKLTHESLHPDSSFLNHRILNNTFYFYNLMSLTFLCHRYPIAAFKLFKRKSAGICTVTRPTL